MKNEYTEETYEVPEEYKADHEPLPISLGIVFQSLREILPDHSHIVINCIKKAVVIKTQCPQIGTIGITANGTLYINQLFWNKYVKDMDGVKTLLLHELYHPIAGDVFQMYDPKEDPEAELKNKANNIAMDSRINALIVNTRTDFDPKPFMKAYYNDEAFKLNFLNKLLAPDSQFTDDPDEQACKKFYDEFYRSKTLCSHHDLYEVVLEILRKQSQQQGGKKVVVKLMGGHSQGSGSGTEVTEEDLKDAEVIEISAEDLEEAKKRWEKNKGRGPGEQQERIDTSAGQEEQDARGDLKKAILDMLAQESANGAGYSQKLATIFINQALGVTEKFNIAEFKQLAFNSIFHNVRSQAKVRTGKYTQSPIVPRRLASLDLIIEASDIEVVMWRANKWTYRIDKNLLPIYLDVSGSTMPYLPEIIRLIANVSDELDYVWGFSNMIAKHSVQDLEEGKIVSTGGTDFDCVVDHAIENEFKHIVVITDGEANCRFGDQKVPSIESVVTILFGSKYKANYFSKVYDATKMIEEVRL